MKNNASRKLLFTTIVIVVLTILSGVLINFLTGNEDVNNWLKENGIGTRQIIYATIIIIALSIFFAYLQFKFSEKKEKTEDKLTDNIEPDLKILYESLKERYKKRYESKLDGRFEITLEVNEDWRFDKPATYKFSAEAKVSEAATAVRKAFDEKGRLLIVGNAGSGKTVLLLNLARQLLGDELKKDQQIPVIFNLASWRDTYENFEDWLVEVLNTGNGLSKDFAKTVLREKKIIFLLDGLDELARNEENAHEIRAKCMESLNDYLREGRRTVICCRREEFAAMQKTTNKDAPVSAKVEVLDLTKPEVLLALQKAQTHNESRAAAENLEKLIETNETVLEVLGTPFYFTTALEVFDKPNFNDNNLPTDADKLKTYLLKNYVDNKIKHTAKLTEFEANPHKIKYWLIRLGQLMEKKHLVNFELADLQPIDLKRRWRYRLVFGLIVGIGAGLTIGLVIGLAVRLVVGFKLGLIVGFTAGFMVSLTVGLVNGLVGGSEDIKTEDNLTLDFTFSSLKEKFVIFLLGVAISVLFGVLITFISGDFIFTLVNTLIIGLFGTLVLVVEMQRKIKPIRYLHSSYQRISSGFNLNFVKTLSFALLIGLLFYPNNYFWIVKYIDIGMPQEIFLFFNVLLSLPFLIFITTPIFRHIYLRLCLWFEGSMPLKYATFLDLAAEARILEKDGGQWRFRHQNLQEYFANLEIETDK